MIHALVETCKKAKQTIELLLYFLRIALAVRVTCTLVHREHGWQPLFSRAAESFMRSRHLLLASDWEHMWHMASEAHRHNTPFLRWRLLAAPRGRGVGFSWRGSGSRIPWALEAGANTEASAAVSRFSRGGRNKCCTRVERVEPQVEIDSSHEGKLTRHMEKNACFLQIWTCAGDDFYVDIWGYVY